MLPRLLRILVTKNHMTAVFYVLETHLTELSNEMNILYYILFVYRIDKRYKVLSHRC